MGYSSQRIASSALLEQRYAGGELVRRGQQDRPRAAQRGQVAGPGAVLVQGQAGDAQPGVGEEVGVEVEAVRLDGDLPDPAAAQHPAQQCDTVGEAGADHDALRVGVRPPGPRQVLGQHGAQFGAALRVAVAEDLVGRGGERLAGGLEPGGAREAGQVGGAGLEVVPGAGPGRPGGGGRRVRAARRGPLGDPGPRALAGGEPAFGDQFGVGVGDRVAGDTQVGGERPGGRQPGARGEATGAHRLPQRLHQSAAQALADRLQMQVRAESGPGIRHVNGPYRRAIGTVTSSP
ncbi:hypothetical protein SBADM41S_00486 [Streptomyces badius]